ncbi:MAG: alpha-ketoacid dehydrogenase subunit beta, partial [Geobacteraceae bacterium]|nr:alpha-ketoacid dehydrogenase subunit beta [Geobacteraceae bacterium]
MPTLNMVQAINLALRQEMERDDRIVLLGEDVGKDGGVFRVTDGLLELFGEQRIVDTPLAESGIVGIAIGMALYGLRPVAEIQFLGFIYPAFDQIFSHAARYRNRSRGKYSCPLVIRAPYGAGIKAPELHEESCEAFFCHMPGVKVVVPSGPWSAKGLLLSALRDPDPVIFLEPTRLYRMIREEVPEEEYTVPLGTARIAREGNDVTVIAWG